MKQKSQKTLDLLSHCQDCKSQCCKHNMFIMTVEDHDKIVESGAPDHAVRVDIPLGSFYVLDYKSGACKYLDNTGACSIQNAKPSVCRTFPRQHKDGIPSNASWCPIISEGRMKRNKLFQEFLDQATVEVMARLEVINKDVYFGVIDAYHDRHSAANLRERQATITYPQQQ